MKALDIMEAAGGIDDEILMEVTSAMQEKNTGKPLRAKRTLRTVLIAAALGKDSKILHFDGFSNDIGATIVCLRAFSLRSTAFLTANRTISVKRRTRA